MEAHKMSFDHKIYCAKDTEYFILADNANKQHPFAESLLDFLYLDLSRQDTTSHIYFAILVYNQLSDAKKKRLLAAAASLQHRLETLFSDVFDVLPTEKPLQEKLTEYMSADDDTARFAFSAISTAYEQVESGIFTEVLYPNSMEEIVEFFVRECLRRELRFRRCKSCGKFFALTGYANTEYCDRLFGGSGKTCKEAGAVRLYRTKITADPVIQAYNKEYKKRFAWIKYKKITKEAFYEWSEQARAERDKCMAKREATNDGDTKLQALKELENWLVKS